MGKLTETNWSSGFNCSQLNPDEERGSPGFDKTSRRLELQKSIGKRRKSKALQEGYEKGSKRLEAGG